jgi:hypothetical protein
MMGYHKDVERFMKRFYDSLFEKDRRAYAAIEAAKLGHGGIGYIAKLFGCDSKTIGHGKQDLCCLPSLPPSKSRKKGADAKGS